MSRFIRRALEKAPRLEKSQLELLLRDSVQANNLYEMSLNSLAQGLVVLDGDHKVLFVNRSAEVLLPWQGLDLGAGPVWNLVADRDMGRFLTEALKGAGALTQQEFTLEKGGLRVLSLNILPLVHQGRIRGNILQIQEVTEAKNKDNRLRRAETLASLTTVAAGVAHEIKNPLGSISIHLQLIQKALNNPEKIPMASVEKFLGIIQEEVERLNGIVVDFLFAVRPMDTTMVLGSMNQVIRDMVEFLTLELQQEKIRVKMDLDEDEAGVLFDPRFIKQAFLNIIKNSMHAMPEGGDLAIATRRLENGLQVKITDTGEGISPENLEKIFEPYFTTKSFGSGLGLTLVYKILREHGADVQVQSKVGVGTTFILVFPLAGRQVNLLQHDGQEAGE